MSCGLVLLLALARLPATLAVDFRSQAARGTDDPQRQTTSSSYLGNPYQQLGVQQQELPLPTLVPADGLFEPPFSADLLAPSFPMLSQLFSSIEGLPQEIKGLSVTTQPTIELASTSTTTASVEAKVSLLLSRELKNPAINF